MVLELGCAVMICQWEQSDSWVVPIGVQLDVMNPGRCRSAGPTISVFADSAKCTDRR